MTYLSYEIVGLSGFRNKRYIDPHPSLGHKQNTRQASKNAAQVSR